MRDSEKALTWTFEGVGEFPGPVGMEGILEEIKKHQQMCECGKVRDLFGHEGVYRFGMRYSHRGKSQ